jgi:hypothetical protein
MSKKYLCAFITLLGSMALLVETSEGAIITTGVYDAGSAIISPNLVPNQVDTTAASSNVTLADFKTDVLAAFNSNTGGVVDWENGTLNGGNQSIDAVYGTSQSQTLTISLTDTTRILQVGTASNGESIPISGSNRTGLGSGTGNNFGLSFSQPLSEFGITVLVRSGARNVTMGVFLDTTDAPADVTFALEAIADGGTGSINGTDDTFFGYKAPPGQSIAKVFFTNSGLIRFDDIGFVVVPEPHTWLLGVTGLLALALVRKQRSH